MRSSISAQSAASTPPAPERMLTSASRWSYSPESMVVISKDSMAARSAVRSSSAIAVASSAAAGSSAASSSAML